MRALIKGGEDEIGRHIADVHLSLARACPHGLEGSDQKDRRRHLRHETPKFLRRPMHRAIYGQQQRRVPADEDHESDADKPAEQPPLGDLIHTVVDKSND